MVYDLVDESELIGVDAVGTLVFSDETSANNLVIHERFSSEIKSTDQVQPVNRLHLHTDILEQFIQELKELNIKRKYILPIKTSHFTAYARLWILLHGPPIITSSGLQVILALSMSMHHASSSSSSVSADLPKTLFAMEFTFRVCERVPAEVYKTSIMHSLDAFSDQFEQKDIKLGSSTVLLSSEDHDVDETMFQQELNEQKGLAFDSKPTYCFTLPFCSNVYTTKEQLDPPSLAATSMELLHSLGLENKTMTDYFYALFEMMKATYSADDKNTSSVRTDHVVEHEVTKELDFYIQMVKQRNAPTRTKQVLRTNEQAIPSLVEEQGRAIFTNVHEETKLAKVRELQQTQVSTYSTLLYSLDSCVDAFRSTLETQCTLRSFYESSKKNVNQMTCWVFHALHSESLMAQLVQYKYKKLYIYASPSFAFENRPAISECDLHPQFNVYMSADTFQRKCMQERLCVCTDSSQENGTIRRPLNFVAWAKLVLVQGTFQIMNMDISIHPEDEVAHERFFTQLRSNLKKELALLAPHSTVTPSAVFDSNSNRAVAPLVEEEEEHQVSSLSSVVEMEKSSMAPTVQEVKKEASPRQICYKNYCVPVPKHMAKHVHFGPPPFRPERHLQEQQQPVNKSTTFGSPPARPVHRHQDKSTASGSHVKPLSSTLRMFF